MYYVCFVVVVIVVSVCMYVCSYSIRSIWKVPLYRHSCLLVQPFPLDNSKIVLQYNDCSIRVYRSAF